MKQFLNKFTLLPLAGYAIAGHIKIPPPLTALPLIHMYLVLITCTHVHTCVCVTGCNCIERGA